MWPIMGPSILKRGLRIAACSDISHPTFFHPAQHKPVPSSLLPDAYYLLRGTSFPTRSYTEAGDLPSTASPSNAPIFLSEPWSAWLCQADLAARMESLSPF